MTIKHNTDPRQNQEIEQQSDLAVRKYSIETKIHKQYKHLWTKNHFKLCEVRNELGFIQPM